MSPFSKYPGRKGGGKIIPFPGPPRLDPESHPPTAFPADLVSAGIDQAWSEELSQLVDEPRTAPLTLVLDQRSGQALLEFLESTGLADLVRLQEAGDNLEIFSQRPTVNRLIVWQALDLGLSFSVRAEPRER
jgi:hypothetical protein